jgi:nitroimidazol reductase NimA-like FMN-containing flavoprotein (pyridoxamine 5'-phosphate oxidase superfamily)
VPYRSALALFARGETMTDAPSSHPKLERIARAVIEANKYMTLATADDAGRPWASPVYYTPEGHDVFYWVSSPNSVHSRNLAQRPDLSIVIFDSQAQIGAAEAVYMVARADIVPEGELERCAATYGSRFPELRVFRPDELWAPAELRLYRARVAEHSVLVRGSDPDFGRGVDTRLVVNL